MIVLGLLFILVAIGATGFALTAPSAAAQTIEVTALGFTVSASPLAMFLAGAVSLALLGLGWALVSGGTRRKARSRKELRQLRKEQAATGANTSGEGGHRASRHDRPQKESSSDAGAGHNKDSSSDVGAGDREDGGKDLQSEQRPDSEPPARS